MNIKLNRSASYFFYIWRSATASTTIIYLFLCSVCFIAFPQIAYKYNSYFYYRFIPNPSWGIIYFTAAAIGFVAITKHSIKLWRYYSMISICIFAFNATSFILSAIYYEGNPINACAQLSFLVTAFRHYTTPHYWLNIVEDLSREKKKQNDPSIM